MNIRPFNTQETINSLMIDFQYYMVFFNDQGIPLKIFLLVEREPNNFQVMKINAFPQPTKNVSISTVGGI